MLLMLVACSEVALLEDGVYAFDSILGDYADANTPPGLTLTLGDGSVAITSDEGELVQAGLDLRPREEWLEGCPTNTTSVDLETASFAAEFSIGELDWVSPLVVPGCGEEGAVYLTPDNGETLGPCTESACMRFVLAAETAG